MQKQAHVFFEDDLNPKRIIESLSYLTHKNIIPGKTLLFFDEIQASPEALTSLRYFYELLPELHVIAAGSLLDFAIEATGIPVGRVESLYLYPLSFLEFLYAQDGGEFFVEKVITHSLEKGLPEPIHKKFLTYVSEYVAIGGMPEAINCWLSTRNPIDCSKIPTRYLMLIGRTLVPMQKSFRLNMSILFSIQSRSSWENDLSIALLRGTIEKENLHHAWIFFQLRELYIEFIMQQVTAFP